MRKEIYILLLYSSCQNRPLSQEVIPDNNKVYTYIEHSKVWSKTTYNQLENKDDTFYIKAISDTDAYSDAYTKFAVSKDMARELIFEFGATNSVPGYFELINQSKENISSKIDTVIKIRIEKDIDSLIRAMDSSEIRYNKKK